MSRGAEKTRVPLLMRDRSFYHTFLILAGTLILEQAVVLSVNLADNLMIGSYNETALAAVAAVNQIVFVVQQVIYGVTNGVIVLSSQYWGKQQTAPIRRLVCLGLRLEAALSMLFFAVVSLWPAQCVGLFVTDAAIIAEGVRYLRVIRFTFPFFAVTTVLLGAMRSVETVSLALKVSVVSLVTNCVINYILIFGRFGAPELGVVGAAIGTLAARALECGIVCVYVFCRDRKLQLRAAELGRSDPALRGDYFRTSVPIVLQAAMWGVLNAIQTAILGHMTASAVAAYSISSTAFLLLKVTSVGACTAASIMVGKQIGSGGKQLRTMVYTMQLLFVGLGAALGIVLFFLRIPLLRVYRISDETRYLANAFFLIQSVVLLTMSYQMPTNAGILRGGGDTRFALVLDLISFWAIVAIVISFGACGFGLQKGIEKVTKVMMIALLLLMIALAVNSAFLPNAAAGIKFYLVPDFGEVAKKGFGNAVFAAMSQAFFTLSIGIGSMEIFGSYLDRKNRITGEAVNIVLLDTLVALMAGFIIIPVCFAYGVEPGSGPSLLFITLPTLFNNMAGGRIWGTLFFIFMSFAALSTIIAVFEEILAFFMDIGGWSRKKAVGVNFVLITVLSLPAILGFNVLSGIQPLGEGSNIMDMEDFLVSSNLLPLGSLVFVLFCVRKNGWGFENFLKEANKGEGIKFPHWIRLYMQYILPLIVVIIYLKGYYDMFSGKSTAVFVSWMCFAVLLLFVIFGVSIFTGRKKTERTK